MKSDVSKIKLWTNVLAYQFCWWLLIYCGVSVLSVTAVILTVGYYLLSESGRRAKWWILLVVTAIGISCDSVLAYWGVYGQVWQENGIALWLYFLWLVFATLLNVSLKWFQEHLLIAALCGAIGGPSSYWAGAKMSHSAELSYDSLQILVVVWLILTPTFLFLCRCLFRWEATDNNSGGERC